MYLGKWGTEGSGLGQFEYPRGLVVAPNGDVYVSDFRNNRVQHFSPRALDRLPEIYEQVFYNSQILGKVMDRLDYIIELLEAR